MDKFLLTTSMIANELGELADQARIISNESYDLPRCNGTNDSAAKVTTGTGLQAVVVRSYDIMSDKYYMQFHMCGYVEKFSFNNKYLTMSISHFSDKFIAPFVRKCSWDTLYIDGVLPI